MKKQSIDALYATKSDRVLARGQTRLPLKVQVTVRLDEDVLRWLRERAGDSGWSTGLNALARRAMKRAGRA